LTGVKRVLVVIYQFVYTTSTTESGKQLTAGSLWQCNVALPGIDSLGVAMCLASTLTTCNLAVNVQSECFMEIKRFVIC